MLIFYTMGVTGNLELVLESINNAAAISGRTSDSIKLVAVSKTVELQRILEAVKAGITILGENRVQEARDKIKELGSQINPTLPTRSLASGRSNGPRGEATGLDSAKRVGQAGSPPLRKEDKVELEWHLIGNLQKNKAKTAVQLFDLIHSLDSVNLAEEINKQAQQIKKVQRVLVQVKLSEEMTKHGISQKNLTGLLEKVSDMDYLKLEGLMTMSPFFEDPEETRPYFRKLRHLAEKASKRGFPVIDLSMGMTNDFKVAIEEGATMVRIGTAIFGKRDNSA